MGQFQLYFQLGIQHILDLKGFDHILFVVALCAIYVLRDWKKIIILVTAFTSRTFYHSGFGHLEIGSSQF
jgi:hypothetical protein